METPNKLKRKRRTISLDVKKALIEASKTKKVAELVIDFDLPDSTIKTILNDKNKDKILKAIDDGASGKRAKLKGAKHSDLEEAILEWLKEVRSDNLPVDGPLLKVS